LTTQSESKRPRSREMEEFVRDQTQGFQQKVTECLDSPIDYRVREVVSAMRCSLDRELTIRGLAESVRLSPSALRLLFKRDLSESPLHYLKRMRLERAKQLICRERLSVKEVAARVGCGDVSHFVRDFERAFGLSPSRYRRSHSQRPDTNLFGQ
jgi:AraC family transcriptional regulator